MAQVIETREPAIVHERETERVRDDSGSNAGLIIGLVVLLLIILALVFWRPWSGGGSGGTNINVPSPSTSSGQ